MKVCIVGGGKVGYYLAKTLLEHGHSPIIIEKDAALCNHLADTLDLHVICGDGTSPDIIAGANPEQCHAMVAVTGSDEANLIACQIAKRVFGVKRTLARVNNPKNLQILKKLGIDVVVSATDNISRIIEREVETNAIHQILSLASGTASLTEIIIEENFPYQGQTLAQLPVPEDVVVISVTRDGELLIPRGSTQLLLQDRVLVLAKDTAFHELTLIWKLGSKTTGKGAYRA